MIELTQEQWQAISQEENPTVIEPDSKTEYVVLRKDTYETLRSGEVEAANPSHIMDASHALNVEEITESLRDEPPVSVQEESKQFQAIENLEKITPSGDVLRKNAIQY